MKSKNYQNFEYCLEVIGTCYGRTCGWFAEFRGEVIAELCNPKSYDVGWDAYDLLPKTTDPEIIHQMDTVEFWHRSDLVFRNRTFTEAVSRAHLVSIHPELPGEIRTYNLYVKIRELTPWEILWNFRRVRTARQSCGKIPMWIAPS